MKHFKQLTLIILTLSLLLCGCGGASTNGTDDNKENNSTTTNNNSNIEKDKYTLGEYLFSGERVWYLAEGFGKDDKIVAIYVTEPNGAMYYCESEWKLGEAEQKDDDEIISYVKQTYEKNMKEHINYALEWEGQINEFDNRLVSDMKSILNPYSENIKPATWKLSIITDSTGNNTEREVFAFQQSAPLTILFDLSQSIVNIELSTILSYESDEGSVNCFQIYDSWYGGARIQDLDCNCPSVFSYHGLCGNNCPYPSFRSDFAYFLTRFDSNKSFELDEVGAKNVGIDNSDSLFEEFVIDLEWEYVNPDEQYY